MIAPQLRQRTFFPRELVGTAKIFRHVRLGHMMRTLSTGIGSLLAVVVYRSVIRSG
ncbi:MAG: hypothetical protein KF768_05035 [Phycisphaeraceae bacterium]|nr:hypothetical protein [Phycisphaeraceae bacterium]